MVVTCSTIFIVVLNLTWIAISTLDETSEIQLGQDIYIDVSIFRYIYIYTLFQKKQYAIIVVRILTQHYWCSSILIEINLYRSIGHPWIYKFKLKSFNKDRQQQTNHYNVGFVESHTTNIVTTQEPKSVYSYIPLMSIRFHMKSHSIHPRIPGVPWFPYLFLWLGVVSDSSYWATEPRRVRHWGPSAAPNVPKLEDRLKSQLFDEFS